MKEQLAALMTENLQNHTAQLRTNMTHEATALTQQLSDMPELLKKERQKIDTQQEKRKLQESLIRAQRLPQGIRGLWHKIIGKYQKTKTQNEKEYLECQRRDRDERRAVVDRQMAER